MRRLILPALLVLFGTSCNRDQNHETPACEHSPAAVEAISIFPATHPLNTDISQAPVDARSSAIINLLLDGFSGGLKADFGSGLWEGAPIGIPFITVCRDQPVVPVTFRANGYDGNYGSESDTGPYRIPLHAPIEGNGRGDSHVIAVDLDDRKLYELYNASRAGNGWQASSGAIFDLTKEEYRPAGWTSADAAGLPIFPCLLRYDEVASGYVTHAIRFTLRRNKVFQGYVHPARHYVSGTNANSNAPTPMGMRLRLKQTVDISNFSPTNQVILTAMKRYGIILADIGSNFYISGAPDSRWNNSDLQQLGQIKPSDFEVVQMPQIITP